jgi:amino acid transporter
VFFWVYVLDNYNTFRKLESDVPLALVVGIGLAITVYTMVWQAVYDQFKRINEQISLALESKSAWISRLKKELKKMGPDSNPSSPLIRFFKYGGLFFFLIRVGSCAFGAENHWEGWAGALGAISFIVSAAIQGTMNASNEKRKNLRMLIAGVE